MSIGRSRRRRAAAQATTSERPAGRGSTDHAGFRRSVAVHVGYLGLGARNLLVSWPANRYYNWQASSKGDCQCHADAHWHRSRSPTNSRINSTGLPGSATLPYALVQRARIILASAEGLNNSAVAKRVGVTPQTVGKWRRRFRAAGIEGLHDELRPGRPRTYDDDQVASVINRALQEKPDAATHWSTRRLGQATGISKSTVQRWLALFGVKPHLAQTFKLSARPVFHREGARHRRALPQPARPRDGPVRGREVADSGAQSHPADAADGPRLRRRLHPRLRPARHDDAVRRPGHRHRQGVRAVPEAASPRGSSCRSCG